MHKRDMILILETHSVILLELLFTVQTINSHPWQLINVMNNCKRLHEKSCSIAMLDGIWPRDSQNGGHI